MRELALAELLDDRERAERLARRQLLLPNSAATSRTRGSTSRRDTRMTSTSASMRSPSTQRSVSALREARLRGRAAHVLGSSPSRRWLIEVISSSEKSRSSSARRMSIVGFMACVTPAAKGDAMVAESPGRDLHATAAMCRGFSPLRCVSTAAGLQRRDAVRSERARSRRRGSSARCSRVERPGGSGRPARGAGSSVSCEPSRPAKPRSRSFS